MTNIAARKKKVNPKSILDDWSAVWELTLEKRQVKHYNSVKSHLNTYQLT